MKPILTLLKIFLLPLFLTLTACSDDAPGPERAYHRLNMNTVSNISSSGATFSAHIFSEGPEPILDHGFVWGKTRPFVDEQSSYVVSLGSKSGPGGLSSTIEHPFERATTYYVRPYVKTQTTIVYGNMVPFEGKW